MNSLVTIPFKKSYVVDNLSSMYSYFVVIPADKAQNTTVFICIIWNISLKKLEFKAKHGIPNRPLHHSRKTKLKKKSQIRPRIWYEHKIIQTGYINFEKSVYGIHLFYKNLHTGYINFTKIFIRNT